jgi:hypothetical protein
MCRRGRTVAHPSYQGRVGPRSMAMQQLRGSGWPQRRLQQTKMDQLAIVDRASHVILEAGPFVQNTRIDGEGGGGGGGGGRGSKHRSAREYATGGRRRRRRGAAWKRAGWALEGHWAAPREHLRVGLLLPLPRRLRDGARRLRPLPARGCERSARRAADGRGDRVQYKAACKWGMLSRWCERVRASKTATPTPCLACTTCLHNMPGGRRRQT